MYVANLDIYSLILLVLLLNHIVIHFTVFFLYGNIIRTNLSTAVIIE